MASNQSKNGSLLALTLLSRGERQEGDVAGPLNRLGEFPLVAGAGSRHAAGDDLATVGNEGADAVVILLIDGDHAVGAEAAGFAAGTAETPARPALTASRGPAFAVASLTVGWSLFSLFHFNLLN
jgi:hypothetical protein